MRPQRKRKNKVPLQCHYATMRADKYGQDTVRRGMGRVDTSVARDKGRARRDRQESTQNRAAGISEKRTLTLHASRLRFQ